MATRVNIFVNKILDDLFHPLSLLLSTTTSPSTVSHIVDVMALNPDGLNLNYDSDDSMQVDSDSEQINNHHTPVQDPDVDADADGDIDDTPFDSVAGPSSYTPKDSVSLTCLYARDFNLRSFTFKGC
jgi:hypothetical protein